MAFFTSSNTTLYKEIVDRNMNLERAGDVAGHRPLGSGLPLCP